MTEEKHWKYDEKLESKYIDLQADWVKRNKIKDGDVVRLVRRFVRWERGWGGEVSYDIGHALKVEYLEVDCIYDEYILLYAHSLGEGFQVPYFALKLPLNSAKLLEVTEEGYRAVVSKKGVRIPGECNFTWKDIDNLNAMKDYFVKLTDTRQLKFGTLTMESPGEYISDTICEVEGLHVFGFPGIKYDVRAFPGNFTVGCQSVEWSVIDDILKIKAGFSK